MPYSSVFRPDLFAGQTIIVTGGGSGIGRCTAHELSSLGAKVILIGRNADKLANVSAEIAEDGGEVDTAVCDIRVEDQVVETVTTLVGRHGRLHHLVNNAGGQFPAPLEKISQKGWETVVRTNLTGGFLMSREVYLQSMSKDGGGGIVNIIADMWHGMPTMGHSGAARAGMLNFTYTAAVEWAKGGVRVNAVAPGWIASSGFDTYDEATQQHMKSLPRYVPLRRTGREAEVSAAIIFLLTPAANFITGTCIRVDGGVPNQVADHPAGDHDNAPEPYLGFHREVLPKVARGDD
ncbi:MAG: SDR family oxidoreductase [Alphaproteobacteria bacterium]